MSNPDSTGNAYDYIMRFLITQRDQRRVPTGVAPGSPYQHRADGAAQALNDVALYVSSLPEELMQALPAGSGPAITAQPGATLPPLALNRSEVEYIIQAIRVREDRAQRNDNALTPNPEGADSIIRHLRTAYDIQATGQLPALSDPQ